MIARLWYEIRWWRWFLFGGYWPMRTLYHGPWRLDKESRRVIIKRVEEPWLAGEPMFNGAYPHRRRTRTEPLPHSIIAEALVRVQVVSAPYTAIKPFGNLPYEVIDRVFDVEACYLTDESSLWDFCSEGGLSINDVRQRIQVYYGVDISDIKNGNLVAVLRRIKGEAT